MTTRPARQSRRRAGQDKPKGFLLTVVDGRLAGREYHFESEATVGRTEDNDVVLIDPGISRKHARIFGRRGVYLVEDLGSANGTRLNGEIITTAEVLRDGDYITVGSVNVMFSNLELDVAGEKTEPMNLPPKKAWKLDHTREHKLPELPPLKDVLKGPRLIVAVLGGLLLLLLPIVTLRVVEFAVALVGLAATGLLLWRLGKLPLVLSKTAYLAAAVFGPIFAGVFVGLLFPKHRARTGPQEWSATPIDYQEYAQSGYETWGMGYSTRHQYPGDVNYRDKITFRYYKSPQPQRITLEYTACGIGEKEVAILLNGHRIGYVPEVEDCKYNLSIELPSDKLKVGDNYITFDNLKNGPNGTEPWQISYVKFREEAIPPPDPAKAREHYQLAMQFYEQREVAPENRQLALKHFRLARDYLEGLKEKPRLYEDAARMIRVIQNELNKKFRAAKFEAKRLIKYRRYEEAAKVLKKARLYFAADKKDPRYIELDQYIETLSQ